MNNPENNVTEASQPIQGRSVFIVESTENGIAVQTSFMAEDGRLLQMACLFPDIERYAFVISKHLSFQDGNFVDYSFCRFEVFGK